MSEQTEQLGAVKKALGRFYGRIDRPTKNERIMFDDASAILTEMMGDTATEQPAPAPAKPQTVENQIDDLTVDEVKRRVQDGQLDAEAVLAQEEAGKNRVTLKDWLQEYMEDEE